MLPSFCRQVIIRQRPSTRIERGSTIYDWKNPDELVIASVSVQPANGYVDVDGRVLGISDTYNVFLNPDDDVIAGDRIIFEGKTFLVDQEPQVWVSPTGRVSSKQFAMTLHRG